jgi:hypothetical protein
LSRPERAAAGPATSPGAAAAASGLIPELNVQNVALADLLQFLRDVDPSFQAVVSYEGGPQNRGPEIQDLKLKNVSTRMVLSLLSQTYHGIDVNAVDTDEGRFYTIRVGEQPTGGGITSGELARAATRKSTSVHRLREIVDTMLAEAGGERTAETRKKALDQALALVQAAVQTDVSGPCRAAGPGARDEDQPARGDGDAGLPRVAGAERTRALDAGRAHAQ